MGTRLGYIWYWKSSSSVMANYKVFLKHPLTAFKNSLSFLFNRKRTQTCSTPFHGRTEHWVSWLLQNSASFRPGSMSSWPTILPTVSRRLSASSRRSLRRERRMISWKGWCILLTELLSWRGWWQMMRSQERFVICLIFVVVGACK